MTDITYQFTICIGHCKAVVPTRERLVRGGAVAQRRTWKGSSLPGRDGELRPAFLGQIKQQLRSDFEQHVETWRRLTDSSEGPGGTE